MTLDDLSGTRYDLLVIGGGAHGLLAALDAASRGLTVALIDRGDFGGTEGPDQRTIGGAAEAFRQGRIGRTRRLVAERRAWARMAPHLLRPLPFLAGTYRWTRRSRILAKAGFRAFDALARHRNARVSPELHLPKSRLESAAATKRLFPGVAPGGLSGGAVWYDYQARYPERLTWTIALAARRAGAALANYVEASGAIREGGRVTGVRVRDVISGAETQLSASVTLVTGAGDVSPLLAALGIAAPAVEVLRTMDVLLNRPARDIALAAETPSGRSLVAVPWHDRMLVGTHYSKRPMAPEAGGPPEEAVDAFLADLNVAFPHFAASHRDILLLYHGFVPAVTSGSRAEPERQPRIVNYSQHGAPGLLSMFAADFTTSRWSAERAVDVVCSVLGRSGGRARSGEAELPHAGIADVEGRLVETLRAIGASLDRDVLEHLVGWYGTEASEVVRFSRDAGLLDRLTEGSRVLAGEVAYAVDHEAAARLSDVLLRRTPLGAAGPPRAEVVARTAALMGARLGWNDERQSAEIADFDRSYPGVTSRAR